MRDEVGTKVEAAFMARASPSLAAVLAEAGTMTKKRNEYRLDADGKLDDVVMWDAELVRLERMDTNAWWLGVTLRDGSRVMFNISAKRAAVEATHWFDQEAEQ